ncbi:hypothetical protein D9M72_576430 [compost metagenome]
MIDPFSSLRRYKTKTLHFGAQLVRVLLRFHGFERVVANGQNKRAADDGAERTGSSTKATESRSHLAGALCGFHRLSELYDCSSCRTERAHQSAQ